MAILQLITAVNDPSGTKKNPTTQRMVKDRLLAKGLSKMLNAIDGVRIDVPSSPSENAWNTHTSAIIYRVIKTGETKATCQVYVDKGKFVVSDGRGAGAKFDDKAEMIAHVKKLTA